MMRLTWLKIHRFRNVKPGTELHFGPKFNVLLGKNASGKTTLLDLVAAISNDNLSLYESQEEDGFDLEYRYISEGHSFCVRTSHLPQEVSEAAKKMLLGFGIAESPPKQRVWALTQADSANQSVFTCEVVGSDAKCTIGQETHFAFTIAAPESSRWCTTQSLLAAWHECAAVEKRQPLGPLAMTSWYQKFYNLAMRFDEALGTFGLMNHATLTLHGSIVDCMFFPIEAGIVLRDRLKVSTEEASSLLSFIEVPALTRALTLLSFASGSFRPQLAKRTSSNGDANYESKDVEFLLSPASGDLIRADLLSFGQERLLSFYWCLAVRGHLPVIADELANGLHHEWIEACVKELSERQSFLATQNPVLLDFLPAGTPDTTLIHCSTDSTDGHGTMCWRNFTQDEQARLDAAYGVGIQQVSEILRSEGLW